MTQCKLRVSRGKLHIKDVAVAQGSAIDGSDAIQLNVDVTKMSKLDAMVMIDALRAKIIASPWPMVPSSPIPTSSRLATSGTEDPSNIAALGGSNVLIQYRTRHQVTEDVSSLTLDEALFYVDGANYNDVDRALPVGTVLNMALETEVVGGLPFVQVREFTFVSSTTYTATGTETKWISTDPLAAAAFGLSKFSKTDILWARRGFLFPTTGASWLVNDASDNTNPTSGESVRGATDNSFNRVNATGAFTGTAGTALASSRFLRPMSLRGVHGGRAVKGMGDSIMDGNAGSSGMNRNGDGSQANTHGGMFRRAFYLAGIAFQKSGRDGNRASNFTAAKMPVRLAQIAAGHYTYVYSNAGTNTLNNFSSAVALAEVEAFADLVKATNPSVKVVWNEVIQRGSSTDQYATLENQAVNKVGTANQFGPNPDAGSGTDVLTPFNAGLRALVGTKLAFVTDLGGPLRDPVKPWLWAVNGTANYSTLDGVHPAGAAHNRAGEAAPAKLQEAIVL